MPFIWGLVAGASFVLGDAISRHARFGGTALGVVLGLGAGALLGAVAYELVDEAGRVSLGSGRIGAGLITGAVVYMLLARRVDRTPSQSPPGTISSQDLARLSLAVAAEAIVIVGALLLGHGIEVSVIAAVFLCGAPKAISEASHFASLGVEPARVTRIWIGMMVLCGIVVAVGHWLLADASGSTLAFTLAFAGGVVLAMLTTHLIPEANERGSYLAGIAVVVGFGLSFALVELGNL
jgi:ZIP family zinc transporter